MYKYMMQQPRQMAPPDSGAAAGAVWYSLDIQSIDDKAGKTHRRRSADPNFGKK